MRKLTVVLMVVSLMLTGVALAAAASLPQSLKGVDLKVSKQVTDTEAQNVRGTAQGPGNLTPGTGVCPSTVCTGPLYLYDYNNNYLAPGPHRK